MPKNILNKAEQEELRDIMYALVVCFNLLNTDLITIDTYDEII